MHPEVRHDLTGTDPTRWSGIRRGICDKRPGAFKDAKSEIFEALTCPEESDAEGIWTSGVGIFEGEVREGEEEMR